MLMMMIMLIDVMMTMPRITIMMMHVDPPVQTIISRGIAATAAEADTTRGWISVGRELQ